MTIPQDTALCPSQSFQWVHSEDEKPFHKVRVYGCTSVKSPAIQCYYNHRQMGWYNARDERIQIVAWQKLKEKAGINGM